MEALGDLQFIGGDEAGGGGGGAVFDLSVRYFADVSAERLPGFIKTAKLLTRRVQRY